MKVQWGSLLRKVAYAVARAASLGIIGRGRRTQEAGELAGELLKKEKSNGSPAEPADTADPK